MHEGRILLAQLMDWLPRYEFDKCVRQYQGNHWVKNFSCWDQFLAMAFAQLTYRESLRDIETCLRALRPKLYHAGIRATISRSTIADANETRDWKIFRDFAQVLITTARKMYAGEPFDLQLDQTTYVLDSTTIDLCLSLFPWARFRKHKAAIKLHTLMDLCGCLPTLVIITPGKVHDVNILDQLIFEPGAFYVMDRAYLDFARLYHIHMSSAFFVTRAKKRFIHQRLYSHPVNRKTGVQCDQTITVQGFLSKEKYPEKLRRIRYLDSETGNRLIFLTNNFQLPALTIAQLYHYRWRIELFFKWIKQHLRIKAFFGTSENAVKTQIWIAISVYVLVAIVKKSLKLNQSLYTILQILSVSLFEKTPILQALSQPDCIFDMENPENALKQMDLFDY